VSFTSPKTWSFGEILTSTDMNTYVRDNTLALRVAGMGTNVVQTVKTDVFTTTSASYVDITGFNVSITPSSTSSLVMVFVDLKVGNTGTSTSGRPVHWQITRNGTAVYVGNAASNRVRSTGSAARDGNSGIYSESGVYIDNPGTTSAVTYRVQVTTASGFATRGTATVNRTADDTDNNTSARTASSITAIEVAA
jgi:hypothetical protein